MPINEKTERRFFFVLSIFAGALTSLLGHGSAVAGILVGYQARRILPLNTHVLSALGLLLGLIPMAIILYFHYEGNQRIIYPVLLLLAEPICWIAAGQWCVYKGDNEEEFPRDPGERFLRKH